MMWILDIMRLSVTPLGCAEAKVYLLVRRA
jgi:hypothetical protein